MHENDFLKTLLDLPPVLVTFIIWLLGLGSLLPLAIKNRVVKAKFLKNPAFMIGDALLLPVAAGFIAYFYQQVQDPLLATTSSGWTSLTLLGGLFLAVFSAVRFRISDPWLLAHGSFYWFYAYLFLTFASKGLYQLVYGGGNTKLWLIWLLATILVIIHLSLGVIWPKKLPPQHV